MEKQHLESEQNTITGQGSPFLRAPISKETYGMGLGIPTSVSVNVNIAEKRLAEGNPLSYFLKEPHLELELESTSAVITPNTTPLAKTPTYKPIIELAKTPQEFESAESVEDTWNFQEDLSSKVMAAKQERREELLSFERKRAELEQQKRLIGQMRRDIEMRESQLAERLLEFEKNYCDILPLLPSLRELQNLGLDPHQIINWIDTVRSIADMRKIDVRAASNHLREELSLYREFGLLKKSIEQTQQQMQQKQQQLTILNITYADREKAIQTLINLQKSGVTMDEIYGLVKMCGMAKFGISMGVC